MNLLTLVRKELVQLFTNKRDVITMFIFPLVLIIVMSNALNGLMNMDRNLFYNKKIYYKINDLDSTNEELKIFYEFMITFERETNVNFVEIYDKVKGIEYVNQNDTVCFIDIYEKDYNYYRNEKKESTESKIFRNIYEQYLKKYVLINSIKKENPAKLQKLLSQEVNILLKNEGINKEEVNSFTYYTFAELILIILYISSTISTSMYKEKSLKTMTRMKILRANNLQIILSKIIFGIVIGILQIIVVYIVSTFLLNVNWGESLFKIFEVLLSLIIFSSTFGIFISMICPNEKTSYIISNILLIVMGFLGGSYVPICLVKSVEITSFLCNIMPTYWANISMISLCYGVNTPYYNISIFISLSLSAILLIIGILISKFKAGEKF